LLTLQIDNMTVPSSGGPIVRGPQGFKSVLRTRFGICQTRKMFPTCIISWRTEKGWKVKADWSCFFSLPGTTDKRVVDSEGKKWDGFLATHTEFDYIEDSTGLEGVKIESLGRFGDWSPLWKTMLEAKILDGEGLARLIAVDKAHVH
jgi:hypothetical protein